VLDVFLARPDDLDRPAHVLRNLDGPHGAVELEAAAEAAAEQVIVDRTCSRFRPVSFMTTACVMPGICVPTQMSQPSFVRRTVQFIGSIAACARKGCS
jgi:hypothetical protein